MRPHDKTPSRNRRITGVVAIMLPLAAACLVLFFWWPRANKPASHDSPAGAPIADGNGSLLEQMAQDRLPGGADFSGPVATDEQLEAQYSTVTENREQVNQFRNDATAAAAARNAGEVKRNVERGKPLLSLLNARLAALEADLAAARRARPNDPVVQWLTGELLIDVGGEPEAVLPYLNRAVSAGLERPRLLVSLATVEFDLNHFQQAYAAASKAIEQDPNSQAAWGIYSRASFAVERFVEVLRKVERTFPGEAPTWAAAIRRSAGELQKSWTRELAQRKQDQEEGDLPQVRLVIEHRQFAGPADGSQAESVKSLGRGEVIIELFEDQAPATVNNFVHLVETGFYDGTSFYWAEAGHMVVGGDPNTKNADPSDDGLGGPGYVIPDEFGLPGARSHFRGTISTVQNGPRKAGSQFFVSLVASPEFDGNSTAFGRVLQGQEVIDGVTEGRTNREVGAFGKIIPGDLLVRAEVIRKRPHAYTVTRISR